MVGLILIIILFIGGISCIVAMICEYLEKRNIQQINAQMEMKRLEILSQNKFYCPKCGEICISDFPKYTGSNNISGSSECTDSNEKEKKD